jgi:hypothetical protein
VGAVGALGVVLGLVASIVLVPAGLRAWRGEARVSNPPNAP